MNKTFTVHMFLDFMLVTVAGANKYLRARVRDPFSVHKHKNMISILIEPPHLDWATSSLYKCNLSATTSKMY